MDLKIFIVTFNDGGWYNGDLPKKHVIATDNHIAEEVAKEQYPQYKTWDCWARELEFEGYKIIVERK